MRSVVEGALPDDAKTPMTLPNTRRPSSAPPDRAPGFLWRPASWGWQLQASALSAVAGHGWSTRPLNPGRDDDHGWPAVAEALGVPLPQLHRLRQVHGAVVHHAAGRHPAERPEADIAIAGPGEAAVAVQVADCVALLIADARTGAVAAAHAGWRGTAADVAGHAVRALASELGARPPDLVAALGPSIGPCCYEVGDELATRFDAAGWDGWTARWFAGRKGRRYLDLWRANRDQLERAGVPPERVFVSGLCTACHPAWFYSYRRDGPGTGRMAGFIGGSIIRD